MLPTAWSRATNRRMSRELLGKKPLAQLEHGTRVYAPSTGEARYRVLATDPVSGERIFSPRAGTADG